MMDMIEDRISLFTILCTILAFVIPLLVYKINEKIHAKADPPWKQEDQKNQQSSPDNGGQ